MKSDFINIMLQVLKDEDVRNEIVNIVNEEIIKVPDYEKEESNNLKDKEQLIDFEKCINEMELENSDLTDKLKMYESLLISAKEQINEYKALIDNVQPEISMYKEKYEKEYEKCKEKEREFINKENEYKAVVGELEELKNKIDLYEIGYKDLNGYFSMFMSLEDNIKENLMNVIRTDNSELFLCSGVQWDNIEALWQFIDYKLNEYDKGQLDILIDTFNSSKE